MSDELTLPTAGEPTAPVDPAGVPTFSDAVDPALQDTIDRAKTEGLGAGDYFLGEHRSKTTVGAAAERSDFQAAAGIVARDPVFVPGSDTTPADFGIEPVFLPVKEAQFQQRRQQALEQIYRQQAYDASPANRTLTNLAAGAAGAFADPINFTGFGSWLTSQWPAGFQAGKLATEAMSAGLSNVVADIATQMTRTVSGAQEHYDPAQTVEAFPVGLTMGTILHGAVHGAAMLGRRMFFGAEAQKAPAEPPGASPAADHEAAGGQVPNAEAATGEAGIEAAPGPATAASPEPATPRAAEGSPGPALEELYRSRTVPTAAAIENPETVLSPFLTSDGRVLDTGNDHTAFADEVGTAAGLPETHGLYEVMRDTRLVRMHLGEQGIGINLAEGQALTPQQIGFLRRYTREHPDAAITWSITDKQGQDVNYGGDLKTLIAKTNAPAPEAVHAAATDILEHTDGDRAAAIGAVAEQIDQGRTLSRDEHGNTVPTEAILEELKNPTKPEPAPAKVAEPLAQAASRAESQPLGRREQLDLIRKSFDELRSRASEAEALTRLDAEQKALEAERGASKREHVEAELQDAFGSDVKDTGVVKVVQSVEDLPARPDGIAHPDDVRGMFDGQHAYVVADNVAPGEVKGVVLHEVGVHYGMRGLLGNDLHAQVLAEVSDRALSGRPEDRAFARAAAAVPADTPIERVPEEILAYLVEHAPEVGLVKRVLASIRQAIYRFTGGRFVNLTEQDLRQMAMAALRRAEGPGRGTGEAVYTRRGDPGVDVADTNLNGFEPSLRVRVDMNGVALPKKPLLLTGTNQKNAAKQIAAIDEVLGKFPDADTSPEAWSRMMAYAFATDDVPLPPYRFLQDINSDGALKSLQRLSPGQIADADHGFANAAVFRQAYLNQEIDANTTGKLFLWSFLSRGVSPYTQEGLFIDAFHGIDQWIEKAARGAFTPDDFPAYEAWAKSVAPQGAGQPGAGATHNLNAFGKLFLYKMSQKDESGLSKLQQLHNLLSDPEQTGQTIRRWFMANTEGVGIDNKVVSFTLLVAGHPDVMVLDRVQIRQLWDDGRFAGRNLYDGRKVDGKPVAGSALSEITYGARGLLIYEAVERALQKRIGKLYADLGRPEAASVGRYHWETWVADSQQEASHGTLDAILHEAKGNPSKIAEVTAKEGEYGGYQYGARYGRDAGGTPYFLYQTPLGSEYRFTVPAFRAFMEDVKAPKNGVIPSKFKVTESGNAPWYLRPEVDQTRLELLANTFAEAGEGPRAVQHAPAGTAGSDLAGSSAGRADAGAYSRRRETPLDSLQLADRLRELHAQIEETPDGKLSFRTKRGTKRNPVRPDHIVNGRPTEHQGTTGGRAQRLEELGVDIAKGFGLIHDDQRSGLMQALLPQESASAARVGRLAPDSMGALGQFSEKTGIARIRTPDELQALVHEVGHKFDQDNRADVDALLQANAAELRTNYGAQKTAKERKELWAGVMEDYALNRKYLQKQAPNTAAQLEQMLAQKHPKQAATLDRLRQNLDAIHDAKSSELVVMSTLAQEHPGMLDALKEAMAKDVAPTGDTLYTVMDALQTASLDKLHPVYRAVEDLRDAVQKKTGQRIDLLPQDDAYILSREISSAPSAASYMLKHGVRAANSYEATGPSLMDGVHTAIGTNYTKDDWQRFGAYLTARRMIAEYARFKSGELKRPPGPYSLGDYQAAVAELEAAHPTFAAGAIQIYAFQQAYLQRVLDKGIITRKFYDASIAKADYVPSVRDMSDLIKGKRVSSRSPGKMLRTSIMQTFRGSDRAVLNPLDSIAKRVHDYEQVIASNDARVALAKLAEVAGTDGAMIFEPIPNSQLIPHSVDVIQALRTAGIQQGLDKVDLEHLLLQAQDAFKGYSPVGTIFRAAPLMHEGGEPIMYYWVAGERRAGRLADGRFGQDLHQAMTAMNESERSWFLSVLQISAQALRTGVTKNPVFVLTNMINDQFSAAGTAGRRYFPFVSAMSGLLDAVHAEIYGLATERGKRAHAYAATGGLAAGAVTDAIEHSRFGMDARSGFRERGFVQKVLLPGKDTLHMLGRLYEASEGGTRLGLFASYVKQGKQMGLDDFNATKYAWFKTQDYMDFRKAGAKMSLLNRTIPFLNAHLQGLTRELTALGDIHLWAKSFRGEPMTAQEVDRLKDARIAWLRVMAIGAVLGTYQTVGNWAHPEFQTGSDYNKDSNYLFKVGDHWIAIPKGFGVMRSITNAFQRGAEYAIRLDPTVLTHWLYSSLDSILPPTHNPLVSLFYDVPANYDRFRDRPIVPFYMQGWDPEKQASLTTSGVAKAIAHVADSYLGRAWSPMKIDYIINNLGGTGARDFLKTVDTLISGEAASKQIYDLPIIQRFVKNLERGSEAQSAFNELVGQTVGRLEKKANAYRGMIDSGQITGAGEYLRDMDEDERVWTLMQRYGDGRANEKRMHPLLNARQQVDVIHGLQRQLNNGNVIKKEDIDNSDATRSKRDAKPVIIDADTRAHLIEELQSLNNGLVRNAMVTVGAKGSTGLPIIDTAPIEQRIQLLSPDVAKEYQARIKNTLDPEKVDALWPQVKARVLEDGDLFDVRGLAKQAMRRKH